MAQTRTAIFRRVPLPETLLFSSFRHFVIAILLLATAFNAAGQGSLIPRPSTQSPDGPDPRSRRPTAPDNSEYQYGSEVYAVMLGCSTCPLGDRPLDEATARQFLVDESLWDRLRPAELDAVKVYLRQRYALR